MQKLCCEPGNVFSDAQSYAGSYVDYAESYMYAALPTTAARAMHYAERYAQSYAPIAA